MLNMKKIKVRKRHFERVKIIFFTLSKFLRINLGTFFQWVLFTYIHKPIYLARILYFKRNSVPYTISILFSHNYRYVSISCMIYFGRHSGFNQFLFFFSFWDIYIHKKKYIKGIYMLLIHIKFNTELESNVKKNYVYLKRSNENIKVVCWLVSRKIYFKIN